MLIARDNGEPLAVDLKTGRKLGEDRLRVNDGQGGSSLAAPGAPAIANGVVVFASDKGLFAYRNVCGNVVRGTNQNEAIEGTKAGDEIAALAGIDTVTTGEGADCVDAGQRRRRRRRRRGRRHDQGRRGRRPPARPAPETTCSRATTATTRCCPTAATTP